METYFVVKFTYNNNDSKLAHVAIHLTGAKTWKLANRISRANYIKDSPESKTHGWSDSFTLMLLNTNQSLWYSEIAASNLSKEQANNLKIELCRQLQNDGYIISSNRRTAASHKNDISIPSFTNGYLYSKTTNIKKLKQYCQRCSAGLKINNNTFNVLLNECYKTLINGTDKISKRTVWMLFHSFSEDINNGNFSKIDNQREDTFTRYSNY